MKTNSGFGKLIDGAIKYAPKTVTITGEHDAKSIYPNPTAEQYLAADDGPWKRIVDERPVAREGFVWNRKGWVEDGDEIKAWWAEELLPAPVPVYSVEEVIYGLITRGKLQAVKAVLGDLYDLITMRETVSADNEILVAEFPRIKAALVSEGIMTEDEIAAILKDAEV